MLISDEKKFIFVHIPKTAGTSIVTALEPYAISTPTGKLHSFLRRFDLPTDYRRFKFGRHARLSDAKRKMPPDLYGEYFKFAVVRNTWDRLVSSYHSEYGLKERPNPNRNYKTPPEFIDFLRKQQRRNDTQLGRITNLDGEVDLDFMLRFEQLDSDMEKLSSKLSFAIELPQLNRSLRKKSRYQDYYDSQSREFVAKHWKAEIDALEYEFD